MTVREIINRHRGAAITVTLFLAAGAVWFAFYRSRNEVAQYGPPQDKSWFTIDDGKTWFGAALGNSSPFDYQGKTAYRCFVFTCEGGKPFVGFLSRDTAKAAAPANQRPRPNPGGPTSLELKAAGTGDAGWVGQLSPQGMSLMQVRCPDGKMAHPLPP